jgi:hypothetical protein
MHSKVRQGKKDGGWSGNLQLFLGWMVVYLKTKWGSTRRNYFQTKKYSTCKLYHEEYIWNDIYILPRVYGSVTNNNRFWIGWLDLVITSWVISLKHRQLQRLTINDCLRLAPFYLLIRFCTTCIISRRIYRNTKIAGGHRQQADPISLLT